MLKELTILLVGAFFLLQHSHALSKCSFGEDAAMKIGRDKFKQDLRDIPFPVVIEPNVQHRAFGYFIQAFYELHYGIVQKGTVALKHVLKDLAVLKPKSERLQCHIDYLYQYVQKVEEFERTSNARQLRLLAVFELLFDFDVIASYEYFKSTKQNELIEDLLCERLLLQHLTAQKLSNQGKEERLRAEVYAKTDTFIGALTEHEKQNEVDFIKMYNEQFKEEFTRLMFVRLVEMHNLSKV